MWCPAVAGVVCPRRGGGVVVVVRFVVVIGAWFSAIEVVAYSSGWFVGAKDFSPLH